jgi:hypothetical protein
MNQESDMDLTKLRAWWWHRQGLDGSLRGADAATALDRAGWVRSVGGANPYMALFARGRISKDAVDAAAASLQIYELPSARGCTYVLPKDDFDLGLRVGQGFGDAATLATAKKFLGVTDEEVELLCQSVLEALSSSEKDPAQLREAVGDRVRNLGDAGKKRGLTTTLPIALGLLQSRGDIRRVPVDGRLDQQRYRYARWQPSPLAGIQADDNEAYTALARHFFRWIGPARASNFQWFSGLGVRAARNAREPLELEEIDDGWLILPEDRDEWERFEAPSEPQYELVMGLDNLILHRRDLASLVDVQGSTAVRAQQVAGSALGSPDLEHQAIFDRGRLIGMWDYDPEAQAIVYATFEAADAALKQVIGETEAFTRDQLGDARSYSLDSVASRQPRLQKLREMAKA